MKTNELILKTLAGIISTFIFLLSLYLYFGGHFAPGGGFVGGLLCTMALSLLMFTYGINKINSILKINTRACLFYIHCNKWNIFWEKFFQTSLYTYTLSPNRWGWTSYSCTIRSWSLFCSCGGFNDYYHIIWKGRKIIWNFIW